MAVNENAETQEQLNQPSSANANSSSEMAKPWLKTLGKDFYQNETLAKYDSLQEAVTDLLKRPTQKDVPETYSLRDGTDEMFRKAGLTKDEAEGIDGYYSKLIPKEYDLEETFGDRYHEMMDLSQKGVKGISDDLADEVEKSGLMKNPTFIKIMARVGKETGGKPFTEPEGKPEKKLSNAEIYARQVLGIRS